MEISILFIITYFYIFKTMLIKDNVQNSVVPPRRGMEMRWGKWKVAIQDKTLGYSIVKFYLALGV